MNKIDLNNNSIRKFQEALEKAKTKYNNALNTHVQNDIKWEDMETLEPHCYNCCLFADNRCKDVSLCLRPTDNYRGFYVKK